MAKLYEAGHTLIDWSERKALGLTLASGWGNMPATPNSRTKLRRFGI
jgi:hypothetical protein